MKNRSNIYLLSIAFAAAIFFAGQTAANGQSMVGTTQKVYSKAKSGVKKGYRVGHTTGGRVWTGSKWVAARSWKGGTWVAHKTANGTKWIYRKAKRVVVGPPVRKP